MQAKTNVYLAEGIVIGAALILLATLVITFSPMLWTDHLLTNAKAPIPTSCTFQTPPSVNGPGIVRCPVWVQYSN